MHPYLRTAILILYLGTTPPIEAASAHSWPPGLSSDARAKLEAYDAQIIAAIQASNTGTLEPAELADFAQQFPQEQVIAAIRAVFGSDWSPLAEYADAALASLPLIKETEPFSSAPVYELDVGRESGEPLESRVKTTAFEEGLASYQMWDPKVVANAAAAMVFAVARENLNHHMVTSPYASTRLAKMTWRDRDALVLYEGGWIFVINYGRSPRGLLYPTVIGAYRR